MSDSIFDRLAELERSIDRELIAAARTRRVATVLIAAIAAFAAVLAAALMVLSWGQ